MTNSEESAYGTSKKCSRDKHGDRVEVGNQIVVLDIDARILEPLPEQEINELKSFIGEVHTIVHINTDGSVLVEKEWLRPGGEIMGHGLAVFPDGFELVHDAT